jgi:hypothetical protein
VPVSVSFEAANRQLDQSLEGHTFDAPLDIVGESIALTIETVEVYPSGEQIAVALEFSAGLPQQLVRRRGPALPARHAGARRPGQPAARLRAGLRLAQPTGPWSTSPPGCSTTRSYAAWRACWCSASPSGWAITRDQINAAIAHYRVSDSVRLHGKIRDATVVALTVTDPAIVAVVQLRGDARLAVAPSR